MAEITSKNFFYINSYIVSFLGLAFFFEISFSAFPWMK